MLHVAFGIPVVILIAALFCCAGVANYAAEAAKGVFYSLIALGLRSACGRAGATRPGAPQ
jgi:hypothetical protein